MRKFLPLIIVLAALAIAIPLLSYLRPPEGLTEGKRAPDFALPAIDGGEIKLSGLRGQVVMLNFWSAGCGPCRAEMPYMQEVYEELRDEGLTIVAVNLDSPLIAAAFAQEYGLTFPVVTDTEYDVSLRYEVQYIPKTLILDRRGIIRFVGVGSFTSAAQLRGLLTNWL
ncbi:MAG TPA: TlpA family protein disulfide reductase [Firmicutes bacterium]|nr:TlpA family protein disulfide reductase [Bacillota bacterium]